MAKRIDEQTRFITFVMEGELTAVEATLKNANAIFASRKKTAGNGNGAGPVAVAVEPKPRKSRKHASEPAAPAPEPAAAAAAVPVEDPEF